MNSLLRSSFTGEYDLNLDQKGRVPVPAAFRKVLTHLAQDTLPLGLGPKGKCLRGFTEGGFNGLIERIDESAKGSNEERARAALIRREVMSNLAMLSLDSQGRVLLPSALREKGALSGETVFVGCGEYFELWPKEAWQEEKQRKDVALKSHEDEILAIYG